MKRKKGMAMGMAAFLVMALCLQGCGKRAEDAAAGQESETTVEQGGHGETNESVAAGKESTKESYTEKQNIGEQDADKKETQMKETQAQNTPKKEPEKKAPVSKQLPELSGIATPATAGALQVEGTQLTDANGNAVQLKGISTHGIAWYPDYVNEDCFRQFREEWNVNVMRLAMYTGENGGYCSGGDKNYLKNLVKSGVEYATALDMYVIIDWHILSDNNPNMHIGEAKDFFTEMAQEYADYNNVLYEICNEPNGGTGWNEVKSYAEEIIGIIRSYDEDGIIIVGTPNWCQFVDQAAADPITDYDNIMYALHFYAATHTDSLRNTMTAAIDAGLPIFVSEYGICDASGNGGINEGQANQWVDTMNAYGVSYVAWNLSNKNETSAIINSNCSKLSGFTDNDLSTSGKWLYRMLTGDAQMGSLGQRGSGQDAGQARNPSSGGENGSHAGNQGNDQSGQEQGNGWNGNDSWDNSPQAAVSLGNGDLSCTAEVKNSWDSGGKVCYQYEVTIQNVSSTDCGSWSIDLSFNEDISFNDGWNGEYSASGNTLRITNKDYNGNIPAGGSIKDIGFIICGSGNLAVAQ